MLNIIKIILFFFFTINLWIFLSLFSINLTKCANFIKAFVRFPFIFAHILHEFALFYFYFLPFFINLHFPFQNYFLFQYLFLFFSFSFSEFIFFPFQQFLFQYFFILIFPFLFSILLRPIFISQCTLLFLIRSSSQFFKLQYNNYPLNHPHYLFYQIHCFCLNPALKNDFV